MAYETITVRMNRSNDTIPWGFTLGIGPGGYPQIATIEKASLADKAGMSPNDIIRELNDRNTQGMSTQEARNLVDRASSEIRLKLERYVTSRSTIPWKLSEKDNQIVVDEIRPSDQYGYRSLQTTNNAYSSDSRRTYEVPVQKTSNYSYRSSMKEEKTTTETTTPGGYQPAPFTNLTNTAGGSQSNQPGTFHDTKSFQTYKEEFVSGATPGRMNESLGSNQSSAYRPIQPDFTSGPTPYVPRAAQRTSRSVERPIHVEMSPQRAYSQSTSPAQYGRGTQSYVSPRAMPQGTDSSTYYPPSHHHERRLSPSASIQHLQYNSPIKLYSPSAAAEQYRQQTGGLFGTDPIVGKEQNAPYLSSGARQLIAEQEQGLDLHHHSAPAQSPCFKRISRAQGTPVD